tara:strand:- start:370 stop:1281 length:912 start_codon:yes stop_codon:yes gene_type:complete
MQYSKMFSNLLIIGCGLIGSSVLRASLNKKISKNFLIFEKSKKNILKIKKINPKIKILKNLDKNLSTVDAVFICTPMSEYKKITIKLNKNLNYKALITDVGSTKKKMIQLKNKFLDKKLQWISSHPIAGSEVSGPEYGNKNLFLNKWCVIIREKKQNIKKVALLKKFWKKIGSNVILMDANKHDEVFSLTSHLPHLIAYNLIKTAQNSEKMQKENLLKFSAGGLRDFSRIAASNEIMWRDIFFSNDNIIKSIDLFSKNLNYFKKLIKNKNNKKMLSNLKNTKKVRKQIVQLKQDIAKPDFGRE